MRVKQGGLDYLTEVAPTLENLMDEIEVLSSQSALPEKVNRKYWNEWLINTLERLWRCELLVTDKCNFKCPYCRGMRPDLKGSLSLEQAKKLFRYLH